MRIRSICLTLLLCALFGCGPGRTSDLALVGAKIYPSPTEQAIEDGTILVHEGRISAVGPGDDVKVPSNAMVIDCNGLVVTAGFWNSHVHVLTPELLHADKLSARQLNLQLQEMLTRWGFTTVFDVASVLDNTTLIRRRIESGEVDGPRILTVGEPLWTKGGTPIYAREFLDANHINIPDVESSAQGTERVSRQIRDGADGIKLFAGSIVKGGVLTMPEDVAKTIVAEAHRMGKPVFAHPSNAAGIEVAIRSGVDILAHPATEEIPDAPAMARRLKAGHVALIPTLTLIDVEGKKGGEPAAEVEKWINMVANQVKAYSGGGVQILFGTDVGYIEQFDTSEEFALMARAGMSFRQILASLTSAPAERFGYSQHSGRVSKGFDGDLVVLGADPSEDVTAFAKVRHTIRGGKIIYSEK